jgi:hypothetical protein
MDVGFLSGVVDGVGEFEVAMEVILQLSYQPRSTVETIMREHKWVYWVHLVYVGGHPSICREGPISCTQSTHCQCCTHLLGYLIMEAHTIQLLIYQKHSIQALEHFLLSMLLRGE